LPDFVSLSKNNKYYFILNFTIVNVFPEPVCPYAKHVIMPLFKIKLIVG